MKVKPTTDSKEKKFLHACRKSHVISKTPLSRHRVSEYLEEIKICNHDTQDGKDNFYIPQLDCEERDDSSKSSTKYPVCYSTSEFDISDLIFSAPTIGSNSTSDNKTDIISAGDDKSEESGLPCDLSEECTSFPMLDDNLDDPQNYDTKPPEGSILHADHSRLKPYSQDSNINGCPDQDNESSDPWSNISNLQDQVDTAPNSSGPTETPSGKRMTLVLDLDETLVHSTLVPCDDADFTFTISFDMKKFAVYVKQRPHLQDFLTKVAKMFEVVVFTASHKSYAQPLLDILDPDGKIISRRAYRESCVFNGETFVKDLTVLGVDLAKVAIIDNSPQVFSLQINNGIPIETWFDDPTDSALISLLPFLETLAKADDVRPIIARQFGNKE